MIDLHVHSHISDGKDSIEEILKEASNRGIKILSFVDHDTTETYARALPLASQYGITLIPGIEISAYDFKRQRKVHVLGYNYTSAAHITALTQPLLERRHNHSLWQLEQIEQAGYTVNREMINRRIKTLPLYKQHIMHALIQLPYDDPAYQSLYKKLFKQKGIAAGDIKYVDVNDAIQAIKHDNGKVIIAHPGQLDSYDLIQELLSMNPKAIDGIETWHYDHSEQDIRRCHEIVQHYHLIETGGSDYHGTFGARYPLGYHTTTLSNFELL
ncbi:PHP domain-containing protein [Macrococcoides caseolyticum]|uniref:PHP domain-containing protein n=1 Tax=Macrococcoides caseolyticum TaxID=69966 RepID=UPI001F157F0A|nr:PHP domain-containing protein [Macrococcus caseolyticus]MCE4956010.1 PHP domain-containing protein [Macrococcus caseolyticus]